VGKFIWFTALLVVGIGLPAITTAESSAQPSDKPLRVTIVGLVHGMKFPASDRPKTSGTKVVIVEESVWQSGRARGDSSISRGKWYDACRLT
jgi:hypothetical protein